MFISFIMYYIYWRENFFSHVKAFSGKTIKYLLLRSCFSLCVPCCSLCVCVNCFVFLEIKNTKTEYFLIRVSLADLGSIE